MGILEFRTLGTVALNWSDGGGDPSVLAQPKRVALLAYLTLARPRGYQRRDTLVAIFWPDLGERRARNALSQALHVLRTSLGESVVTGLGAQEVGVDDESLWCDAIRFERDLAAGRPASAFELYRGELLHGLHVPGSVPFAQWLDLERDRLRRMAGDAARQAASQVEEDGSPGAALAVLHRALELFPADEDLFRRLVEVLHASGDRVGVLRAWEVFRRRLLEDIGVQPSAETERMVEQARKDHRAPMRGAGPSAGDGRTVRSIAVLPLQELTSKAGSYSGDSMTEALITEVGRVRALRVISHQSVLRFKDSRQGLGEIAGRLGVDAVIEGSVLEVGGRVRVTAQLVRAEPEHLLWSDAFEADAHDILAVHRDVARAVAGAVSAVLSTEEQRQLTHHEPVDPAAYEAFLQGWMKFVTVNPPEMAEALNCYQRAIELDPTFAPPLTGLVNVHFLLLVTGEVSLEVVPTMMDTIDLAVKLDPTLARAYAVRALVRMIVHDWSGAEGDLTRATAAAPNLALSYANLALLLTTTSRFDEAAAAAETARRLDPLAPYAQFIGGWCSHYAGRASDAVRRLRGALDLFPDYPMAWLFLAKSLYQLEDRAATIHACGRSLALMGENPMTLAYAAHMLAQVGEQRAAEDAMARFATQRAVRGFASPYYAAVALCGLGRREEALDQIDRLESAATDVGWLLGCDPLLDPLRDEPRFVAALERVGLTS